LKARNGRLLATYPTSQREGRYISAGRTVEYHGIFEFHSIVNDEYRSFEAKFTDGKLVEITRSE